MTDTEIESFSTLLILIVGTLVFSGTVGWWVFLRAFRMVDNYLQDRQHKGNGWKRTVDEDGKAWYIR